MASFQLKETQMVKGITKVINSQPSNESISGIIKIPAKQKYSVLQVPLEAIA